MTAYAQQAQALPLPRVAAGELPPPLLEYAFYGYLFYSYLGDIVGVSIPLLGIGSLFSMACYCLLIDIRRPITAYWSQRFAFGCAISYLIVEIFVHGYGLMDPYVKEFVPWTLMLIVITALVRRDGFILRFAGVALCIGLCLLPFIQFWGTDAVARAGLDRSAGNTGGLANSNSLAEWFGFCCICCVIVCIESKRNVFRGAALILGLACLFVVGLTVSRGTLLSVAFAVIIACRRALKRGFVPLLALTLVALIAFASGMFDSVAASYEARGAQDSGRFSVWPLAIARWMAVPFTGVGAGNVATLVVKAEKWVTPHNSFIFIALSAGAFPVIFFALYWFQAFRGVMAAHRVRTMDGPFLLPLVAYAFLTTQFGGLTFMWPWMLVTMASVTVTGAVAHDYARARSDQRVRIQVAQHPARGASPPRRAFGYRFHAN